MYENRFAYRKRERTYAQGVPMAALVGFVPLAGSRFAPTLLRPGSSAMVTARRQEEPRQIAVEEAGAQATHEGAEANNGAVIQDLIQDLVGKQQALSNLIDQLLAEEEVEGPPGESRGPGPRPLWVQDLARLMALHSQNAARLGRLLRDKRAISGEAADGIAGAISLALDELANEWGIEL
jgi:hypothetical protein